MIILITYVEDGQVWVSHGVQADTLRDVVLPQEPLSRFTGARYSPSLGDWYLVENDKPNNGRGRGEA